MSLEPFRRRPQSAHSSQTPIPAACPYAWTSGDIEAGETFLEELTPFVWRKYLDYAAIADVHAMKRQIHAVKGFGAIAVYA